MSQENVEVVRRGYDAFNRGDIEGVIETVGSEVHWDMSERVFNPAVYEGHNGIRASLRRSMRSGRTFDWSRWSSSTRETRSSSLISSRKRKGSGVDVELPSTSVYTLRGSKVIESRMYREHAEALEAAGLRE